MILISSIIQSHYKKESGYEQDCAMQLLPRWLAREVLERLQAFPPLLARYRLVRL